MALLDAYGRPVRLQKLAQPLAEPGVTSVRQAWSGTVASGLTPERMAAILRACDDGDLEEFLILAEEMEERDLHYQSVLGTRKRAVSAVRPTIKPASDAARDKEIAAAVERDIAGHAGFSDLVEDMLDALGKGFSVIEIEWKRGPTLWVPQSFDWVDPRFFRFDRASGRRLLLLDDAEPVDGLELEPFKFIRHFARLKSGKPFRGGLARLVAFGWMCKSYTLKDWMAFVETYGLPLRLGRYGPDATADDVRTLFRAVAGIGTDAAAVLPDSMRIEFENGPAASADKVFENLARYIDEQVSKGVLGQTMTADNGSSQAQATVHNEVRLDIAQSDAGRVAGTLSRDLVRPYVDLNFGVQETYPGIEIEISAPEDVAAWVTSVVELAGAGMKIAARDVRSKMRLSQPEPDDEVFGGAAPAPAVGAPPPDRMAMNREQPPTDDVDEIAAGMVDDWQEVADGLLEAVSRAMDGATSYEDLLVRLPEALRHMPTALTVDTLVKGMFQARAIGDQKNG